VVSCCEHGDEPTVSQNVGYFLTVSELLDSKEELCFTELLTEELTLHRS